MTELEHFRLKTLDLGQLTGVSIAAHAVPDAFLLLHCGVGCKHKATSQLSSHDPSRSVVEREGWTEVGDVELIAGSADRLGPYLRSWQQRVQPGLMLVSSVTFLDLSGDDFRHAVRQAGAPLPCAIHFVPAPGTHGDLFDGYASAVLEIARGLDWSQPTQPDQVAVLGYLFDRYQGDHAGNLEQLRRLLRDLGLSLGATLLSGAPYSALSSAPQAGTLVALPYLSPRARGVRRLTGRELVSTDLPMGLDGTSRWLRAVGAASGVSPRRVEGVITTRTAQTQQRLALARSRLGGKRVAVFADRPALLGWLCLLHELDMVPVLAGLKGSSLGDIPGLRSQLAERGLPDDLEILPQPSVHRVGQRVGALLAEGRLDGILGSATDLNAVTTQPVEVFERAPFVLEIGFPCKSWHVLRPTPWLGYAGVLAQADRLLAAQRLHYDGRQR